MYKLPIVLYWGDTDGHNKPGSILEQLLEFGLSLTACNNLTDLRNQIDITHKADKAALVFVLDAQSKQARTAIALVRALCSQAGILVLLDTQKEHEIIDYIQAGSDLYCDHGSSVALQAALIWRLVNRTPVLNPIANQSSALLADQPENGSLQQSYEASQVSEDQPVPFKESVAPSHDGPWAFLSNGWILMSPCKKQIKLTTVERRFFIRLLESPDYQATHKELLKAISFSEVNEPTRKQLMNLSVVVSRIKRKGTKEGVSIPLESVHGTGYMFAPGHFGVVSSAASQ